MLTASEIEELRKADTDVMPLLGGGAPDGEDE